VLHKSIPAYFLHLFLPVLVLVLASTYLYGRAEYEGELTRLKDQETLNVRLGARELSRRLEAIVRHLHYLIGVRALREALDAPTPQHLNRLAATIANFSRSQGVFDQVRWIDEAGMEKVRVDLANGEAAIIPAERLQDKSERYYFTATVKLEPGEIFVSPLDLNIEQGKVEVPYKPSLRVATPVADSRGTMRGIFVLNYRAALMLDAYSETISNSLDHAMVVNGEGYWLKGPKAEDEWGFMFHRPDSSLAAQAPGAWTRIRSAESGQQQLADGLWTWQSVYPLRVGREFGLDTHVALGSRVEGVKDNPYVWTSLSHLSNGALSALQQAIWSQLAIAAAVLSALLGIGSWKLARAWTELAKSEGLLRESRDQLDAINLSVGNGIVSVDEQQRIVNFNAAAERIFGYSAAAVMGQSLSILLPERFRESHTQHIRDFDAGGRRDRTMGIYGLVYGLRANGEEFPIEGTVSQSGISPNKRYTVVLRDITERRRTEQVREQLMLQLEQLSARLAAGQEGERQKLAYELHEELGQELATLRLYLQMIGPGGDSAQAQTSREKALALASKATDRIRKIVLDLEPRELEDLGLEAAVRIYCRGQAALNGWVIEIDAPIAMPRAPRSIERACFRLVQDTLNNISEYAKVSKVWVKLLQDASDLELVIRTDGIGSARPADGIDVEKSAEQLALLAMKMRAKQAGGILEMVSNAGVGTEVRAVFPLPEDDSEPD